MGAVTASARRCDSHCAGDRACRQCSAVTPEMADRYLVAILSAATAAPAGAATLASLSRRGAIGDAWAYHLRRGHAHAKHLKARHRRGLLLAKRDRVGEARISRAGVVARAACCRPGADRRPMPLQIMICLPCNSAALCVCMVVDAASCRCFSLVTSRFPMALGSARR